MGVQEQKIEGRNAVIEAYRSGKPIDKIYIQDGCQDGPIMTVKREARKHETPIKYVDRERLDQMSETGRHQGVIAVAGAYEYAQLEEILAAARAKGEPPFLFLLDNIEDPHNLGDYSQKQGGRSDGRRGPDFGGGAELYPCGQGYQPCPDH